MIDTLLMSLAIVGLLAALGSALLITLVSFVFVYEHFRRTRRRQGPTAASSRPRSLAPARPELNGHRQVTQVKPRRARQ